MQGRLCSWGPSQQVGNYVRVEQGVSDGTVPIGLCHPPPGKLLGASSAPDSVVSEAESEDMGLGSGQSPGENAPWYLGEASHPRWCHLPSLPCNMFDDSSDGHEERLRRRHTGTLSLCPVRVHVQPLCVPESLTDRGADCISSSRVPAPFRPCCS